ncbi:MAG: hypothetical protein ACTSW1_05680 [Candidatus Hodarchaeales archaeon]
MVKSGFFITLYDVDTLNLYLDRGLYSFLMPPTFGKISSRSNHYAALADYSGGRKGTHVFFFLKRKIVYGGELVGPDNIAAYYLNGEYCPIGRTSRAPLVWDESERECYPATEKHGIFEVITQSGVKERCQPYLIRFTDRIGLKGQTITSDDLYFELGSYSYPLPSNSIQGMSFCTLTPGEVEVLLSLLKKSNENIYSESIEQIELYAEPLPYKPEYDISNVHEATSESHLEAAVLANQSLLPEQLRPPKESVLCRQVPISPFKPYQMDRADITYYTKESLANGTIPNTIIELKNKKAGKNEALQVVRYARWLEKIVPTLFDQISIYLYAPSFTGNISNYIPREYSTNINLIPFSSPFKRLEDF